jgi:hypothetical protein
MRFKIKGSKNNLSQITAEHQYDVYRYSTIVIVVGH